MRRRVAWLIGLHLLTTAVLLGRLLVLTVLPDEGPAGRAGHGVRLRAQAEHLLTWTVDDGRGRIRYRNGQPVSDADPLFGAVGLPDRWPDPHRPVMEQGRSGLQLTFDRVLQSRRAERVGVLEDAAGTPRGLVYRVAADPGWDLRTTLDPAWQRVAASALADYGVREGAVVVLDVATGSALAMASRSPRGAITAVRAYTPGSVFKLVTAAAATASYRYRGSDRFICRGAVEQPGIRMRCWRVHGEETLTDALAASCDVAFAEVGAALGRRAFEEMASRLRLEGVPLQRLSGRPVLAEAEPGRVFGAPGDDPGRLANTAIGQQDVRLSPLAAANLVRTIAAGGVAHPVRLVEGAEREGRLVAFPRDPDRRVLSPYVAGWLAAAMREAVVSPLGTAHALAGLPVTCAVKTGTAERPDGRVNAWVAGFMPAERPVVAFCVLVAGEPAAVGHRQAFGVTSDLVRAIARFDPRAARPKIGRDVERNALPSSGIDSMMVRGWSREKRLPKE
ncbi:penicillin-binding transpeptidase domain-containing protein [Alicyclobacillus sp.]|uniref:penicillin-binding transpeptidase domain-containing protein n=1 Tax=Alicyclobacillus sp. TaxID=61169 RepID=UPI0025C63F1D|nr:penicillin-binding transpeptidase domain-containing protein [Alicyclobacillus sp.]MCL6515967.1 hypothetical protein [Alicyclobacillus sp.]